MKKWSDDDINLLITKYEKIGPTLLSKELDRNPKNISQKARSIGLIFDSSKFYKSYDFDLVVSNSKNLVDICRNLGLKLTGGNRNTIKKWIKEKNLDTSHFFIEKSNYNSSNYILDIDLFVSNSKTDRRQIKNRLYKIGWERKCKMCSQGEYWMGKKISLILDHINGINDDNRIDNLRILCPNCNSTLDTNGGKNIKNKLKQIKMNTLSQYQQQQKINQSD